MASANGILPFTYRVDYEKGIHLKPSPLDISSSQYKGLEVSASSFQSYMIVGQHLRSEATYPHRAQAHRVALGAKIVLRLGWFGVVGPHLFDTFQTTISEKDCPIFFSDIATAFSITGIQDLERVVEVIASLLLRICYWQLFLPLQLLRVHRRLERVQAAIPT
ncbi:hypothetical protein BDW67DRAFT_49150 [Aspergillus spinulosporus]